MTLKLSKKVQLLQGFIYVFLVGCFDNVVFFFFFFGYKDECLYKNMSDTDNCLFLSPPKL